MYILGTPNFVTPLLGASIHAGIEVCVVEDDGVCIKHSPNSRAAVVGEDTAEYLPVSVKQFHILLEGHNRKRYLVCYLMIYSKLQQDSFFLTHFNCFTVV